MACTASSDREPPWMARENGDRSGCVPVTIVASDHTIRKPTAAAAAAPVRNAQGRAAAHRDGGAGAGSPGGPAPPPGAAPDSRSRRSASCTACTYWARTPL